MTVGAGIGVGDRLEIHHVLPEISRLDARQELLRRVVHARVALVRRDLGSRGGGAERAEGHEAEQDEPRLRQSRPRAMYQCVISFAAIPTYVLAGVVVNGWRLFT